MFEELLKLVNALQNDEAKSAFLPVIEKAKQEVESLTSRERGANTAMNKANAEIEALKKQLAEIEDTKRDKPKKDGEDSEVKKQLDELKATLEKERQEMAKEKLLNARRDLIAKKAKESGVPEALMSHLVNPIDDDESFNSKLTEFEKAYSEEVRKTNIEKQGNITVPSGFNRNVVGKINIGKAR